MPAEGLPRRGGGSCSPRAIPPDTPVADIAADAGTADLGPFVSTIDAAAVRGVVLELHAEHPTSWLPGVRDGVLGSPACRAEAAARAFGRVRENPRRRAGKRWLTGLG